MSIPRAKPPSDAIEIEGEVPFHDVDALRIVWHGHYFKYLELARTALFRHHGIDRELWGIGYRFVVAETECRHISALTYGEKYRVKAWFLDTASRVHVAYEVWNMTQDKRVARARTALVTTDREGELFLNTPALILDRINGAANASEKA